MGGDAALRSARWSAQEYLLSRYLLLTLTDGSKVGVWATEFLYPPRWRYSALRAVDHFRAAALFDGVEPDPRLSDAVDVIRAAERPDGRWEQQGRLPGRTWFDVDVPEGGPSPWVTFTALRALAWWDDCRP